MANPAARRGASIKSSSTKPCRFAAATNPPYMPTPVSKALAIVTAIPCSIKKSAIANVRRTPPNGATFNTATSHARRRATSKGSSARRIDSSAATCANTPIRGKAARNCASSSTVAHGCSAYCKGPKRRTAWVACSTDHARLASTRICATTSRAAQYSRTAATLATSSSTLPSSHGRSATFTFTVRHPGKRSNTSATCPGATAGTVALTSTESRFTAGKPTCDCSIPAANHAAAS